MSSKRKRELFFDNQSTDNDGPRHKSRGALLQHRRNLQEDIPGSNPEYSQVNGETVEDGRVLGKSLVTAKERIMRELNSSCDHLLHPDASREIPNLEGMCKEIHHSTLGGKESVRMLREGQSLFKACGAALASAEKYGARLANTANQVHPCEDVAEAWRSDICSLTRVVGFGRQYGKHVANCMITGSRPFLPTSTETDEDGQFAVELFYNSTEAAAKGCTWGKLVREQVKGLKMLRPRLSVDDGELTPPPLNV